MQEVFNYCLLAVLVMGTLFIVIPLFLQCCISAATRGYYDTLFTTARRHEAEVARLKLTKEVNELREKFQQKGV